MDREDEGCIVFYDAEGNIAAVNCLYDPNADIGGTDTGSHIPNTSPARPSKRSPRANTTNSMREYGAPIYQLTYEGETTNAVMNVPDLLEFHGPGRCGKLAYGRILYGPTQIYVNMDSQTAAEGVMFLYGANWNVVMVIICTLNI